MAEKDEGNRANGAKVQASMARNGSDGRDAAGNQSITRQRIAS